MMPFTYQLDDKWFVAGNKPATVAAFAADKGTKHAFTDKLKGHYCAFYLDVQRLLKTNFTKEPGVRNMLSDAAAIWQDVVMVANEYKDGVATGEMTINFVDGKTNALKQLNGFVEKMNASRKTAEKVALEQGGTVQMDSVMAMPAEPMAPVAEPKR